MSEFERLDLNDLQDFFEDGFSATEQAAQRWSFIISDGRYAGYTVTLTGENLADSGIFPSTGTVQSVAIADADGLTTTYSGFSIPASEISEKIELEDEDEDSDDDDIWSGDGDDEIDTGDGDDEVHAGDGDDDLDGGDGRDCLIGDAGDDMFDGGRGNDRLIGGVGIDTADYADALTGMKVDLARGYAKGEGKDILVGIENVQGSDYRDQLKGDSAANELFGNGGRDKLYGAAGDDLLDGGDGRDMLFGGVGDDHLTGGLDDDRLQGNAGNDELLGGDGDDRLQGGAGDDVLAGDGGDDRLEGGAGADIFVFGLDFGDDEIRHFEEGDLIDLSGTGLSFTDLQIEVEDSWATIYTAQGTIEVQFNSVPVQESDFLFA